MTHPLHVLVVFSCLLFVQAVCPDWYCVAVKAQESQAPPEPEESLMPTRVWSYPPSKKLDHVDNYHGTQVVDAYRWLEDVDSEATKSWVASQNELTQSYLKEIPQREAFKERLQKLWTHERFGIPKERGGKFFFEYNPGDKDQNQLLVADSSTGAPRILLDPNLLSSDGTVSLAGWAPSEDGKLLAYGIAAGGSDWREWRVRDVQTGKDLPDLIRWVKFSEAAWTPDGKGFYYARYAEPKPGEELTGSLFFQKLYYHTLGEPQSQDVLVYEKPDQPKWGMGGEVSEDGRWLIITVWESTSPKNLVLVKDLQRPESQIVELITGFDAEYVFLASEGDNLWFRTDNQAERGRIIAVNVNHPERAAWGAVVAETPDTMESASFAGGKFFVSYLHDAYSLVRVYDKAGKLENSIDLPGIGSVAGFAGKAEDTRTYYAFTGFTRPNTIYEYNITTRESQIFKQPKLDFNAADFVTEQVFATGKDGVKLPLFIVRKKNLPQGPQPCLLYGYGGFNIPITPTFSVSNLVWLEQGGVYVVANLRGGGEYGRTWHEAGMRERKQNVFDDFITAAEYLIARKITSRDQLAISGRSNGGLLVGACMAQRPDLYAAALPGVGVMDMLRFHKFTIGWAWVDEFGSSDDARQFEVIYKYSPLHNLKDGGHYPATLITTADHDDRVVPGHSFKFAARLQAAQGGSKPVLIRIETSAGHGAGTPVSKRVDQAADELSFLVRELKVP